MTAPGDGAARPVAQRLVNMRFTPLQCAKILVYGGLKMIEWTRRNSNAGAVLVALPGSPEGLVPMPAHNTITVPCEQCGEPFAARIDKREKGQGRFCSQSCFMLWRNRVSPMIGENHPGWHGGRSVSNLGYVFVYIERGDPFYEMANRTGRVQEHRLVMARHLGRPLLDDEVVHHLNHIKTDNRIENLTLLSSSEHGRLHGLERGGLNGI